jgi:hypothetical protein
MMASTWILRPPYIGRPMSWVGSVLLGFQAHAEASPLLPMLLRLKRMHTRVRMMSLLTLMNRRSRSIVPLLGPTSCIWLLTLSGWMMMLVLRLFSPLVSSNNFLQSLWASVLLLTYGLTFVSLTNHPGMLFICSWFIRSMLFSMVILPFIFHHLPSRFY